MSRTRDDVNVRLFGARPGIIVKTCVDDCSACEVQLEKEIDLELQYLDLQNKLLAKQIELLEKSQEYRCCPAGETGGGTQ
jgi:hypothetical protein